MNWFLVILIVLLALSVIDLIIISLNQKNFFFQVLYAFTCDHEQWKRYRRLKKYLKTNLIPFINIINYTGDNAGFAFIQYEDTIFVIQGSTIYISSYYSHLIKYLLKHNNYAIRRALQ